MSVLDAKRRHEDLIEELIAEVETYNSDVDKDLLRRAFETAERAHEGQTRRSGRGVHPPPARRRAHLRRAPSRRADDRGGAHARRRRGQRRRGGRDPGGVRPGDRAARRGRHEADPDHVPEPRAGGGRELPEDDRRDGAGRARHPHQARRPPPQHADDRVPREAEAGAEGPRDARGLRAARAPARHPRAQVGARGPLVPDAPSAEVRGDQGDGRRPARRPRGAGREGRGDPRGRAAQGGRPGGDHRPREAPLLDLRQDGQARAGVQRDPRPHRDARHLRAHGRRGDARLLRGARPRPLALEADARAGSRTSSRCPS